jgi:two-component system phosphate regulon response regulator OmpR
MQAPEKILVVDDDPDIRQLLVDYLSEAGYEVATADNADAARAELDGNPPRVVLLDIGLPGEDGLSLARFIRERHDVGIIMVSGAGETVDRIIGLEVGADDYVSKPFDPRELRARLKSVIRRYQRSGKTQQASSEQDGAAARVPIGTCELDNRRQQLFDANGDEIPLTRMEYDLLCVFLERPNRPLSRDQLLNLTQNRDWDPYDRSVDIRITRLRRKIEPATDKPRLIRTVRGVGYMYVPD